MSLDDEGNFILVGTHLNCSGDVIFTNGITVSNGVNLSYDSNTALNMDSPGSHLIGPLSVSGALKANGGLSSNSITIGGSVSSATVAVTGSGAFSQDLSAKSIQLTGAQAPITNTLDVTGSCNITGSLTISGNVSMTNYLLDEILGQLQD